MAEGYDYPNEILTKPCISNITYQGESVGTVKEDYLYFPIIDGYDLIDVRLQVANPNMISCLSNIYNKNVSENRYEVRFYTYIAVYGISVISGLGIYKKN